MTLLLALLGQLALADVQVSVTADRQEISLDESLALKITISSDSVQGSDFQGMTYDAPDFDLINEYNAGVRVESYYDNGRFGAKKTQMMTRILRPKKSGKLLIAAIKVKVGDQEYPASDISIEVVPGGQGTPPPRGYGGSGAGLRGVQKRNLKNAFFVSAEIDKSKLYKGEQLIVSYYIYFRTTIRNIHSTKYPVLDGFLREEMEMPILGTSLHIEKHNLDGVQYNRALLARYAAYPLKEGKLPIDAMSLEVEYYDPSRRGSGGVFDDDEDPFSGVFPQFSQAFNMQKGTTTSEPVSVEVVGLPADGKPQDFSGAIGEFSLSLQTDRQELKANDALTATVKLDGRGSVASIEKLNFTPPEGMDLFDSKGTIKTPTAGIGSKVFEYVMIPRKEGIFSVGPFSLSYFNPKKGTYETARAEPIQIRVQGVSLNASSGLSPGGTSTSPASPAEAMPNLVFVPRDKGSNDKIQKSRIWIEVILGAIASLLLLVSYLLIFKSTALKVSRPKSAGVAAWKKKLASLESGSYEDLAGIVYGALDGQYSGLASRSLPRSELKRILIDEKGVSPEVANELEKVLETIEMLAFSSQKSPDGFKEAVKQVSQLINKLNRNN